MYIKQDLVIMYIQSPSEKRTNSVCRSDIMSHASDTAVPLLLCLTDYQCRKLPLPVRLKETTSQVSGIQDGLTIVLRTIPAMRIVP